MKKFIYGAIFGFIIGLVWSVLNIWAFFSSDPEMAAALAGRMKGRLGIWIYGEEAWATMVAKERRHPYMTDYTRSRTPRRRNPISPIGKDDGNAEAGPA